MIIEMGILVLGFLFFLLGFWFVLGGVVLFVFSGYKL